MTEKWFQSKTFWGGVGQIIAGVSGLCTGQMEITGAGALIVSGVFQVIQRLMALKKADQASLPGGTPGATGA